MSLGVAEAHDPEVRPEGLTSAQVAELRRTHGPNVLPARASSPPWKQLVAQFGHFFALLLWVAGGLAIAGGVPELGVAIFAVVVLNGIFAFVQEHRAERASERLRDLVPRRVLVVRDGRRAEIDAEDLVPGDRVLLTAGSRISADLVAVEAHGLVVDESILTGESAPVDVVAGGSLYAGTFLTEGEGVAEVCATGADTELGRVAELTRATRRPPTPLARELQRLVRTVAVIAVSVGAVFFVVMVAGVGTSTTDGFVFAVGITVALVPEGLLPTVTLALSVGAQRMARRHALVRRLESVETLGSTTFICTDKTGTLTENRMNVAEVWTPVGTVEVAGSGYAPDAVVTGDRRAMPAAAEVARTARVCSVGRAELADGVWTAHGDPVEAAIDTLWRRLASGEEPPPVGDRSDRRFAFDPRRRRSSVVADGIVAVKGAPDAVLPVCRGDLTSAQAAVDALAGRGRRVLAVARRELVDGEQVDTAAAAERDLELVGLLALHDPPRAGTKEALERCRSAGIRVAMVTGDHRLTATAVADAVGLRLPGSPVFDGDALPDDDAALGELIDRDGVVLCRVTPEGKLRIARALQSRGHVVAMTGDGVNDGPALQEADIGVAMGRSGTDVAREAADLVLLDDEFSTIVDAVELGRATFANARQFLTYHLTDNVAEISPFLVWAMSGGRFPLALGVLQILALDLGTDTLSAAALGAEPPTDDALDHPPASGRLLDGTVARRAFGVLGPLEAVFGIAAFLATLAAAGWRPVDGFPDSLDVTAASGATFATVVVAQTANAFACRRRDQPAWTAPVWGNRLLVGAALVELAFAAAMLFVGPFARFLEHAAPNGAGWLVALLSVPVILVADGAVKRAALR